MTRARILALAALVPLAALAACGGSGGQANGSDTTGGAAATTAATTEASTTTSGAGAAATVVSAETTGAAVLAANAERHDGADDLTWDPADEVAVTLTGNGASADGDGVEIDGTTVTITAAGTYRLSGSLGDGQVVVQSDGEGIVRLVLDGVTIHSSTSAPLAVLAADEAVIVLADGTESSLSDEEGYVFASADVDEPNATLFSAADLTIGGNGSLTVTGSYNDGIASKDGLVVLGGTITVTAADDGIRGKDDVAIDAGTVTVTAGGDGIKADNEEDATKGWISIAGGTLDVTAGGDGVQAATDLVVLGGDTTVAAGGGHAASLAADASAKGLKAAVALVIDDGTVSIDSADDALHSDTAIVVNGGEIEAATGDDGIHADQAVTVDGGLIEITESYEGVEASQLTFNGGRVTVVASDDALNAVGDNDAAAAGGNDSFATGDHQLVITGTELVLEAGGDGIDINGDVTMTGGVLLVNGPTESMNGALDYDGTFDISGGVLVATGSAGMAMAPSTDSAQASLMATFASQAAGTLVHIETSDGTDLLTFQPTKAFQSIVVSTPAVDPSATYQVYVGGSSTGTAVDGLVEGDYTPGELVATTTSADAVSRGMGPGGGMPGGGGPRG